METRLEFAGVVASTMFDHSCSEPALAPSGSDAKRHFRHAVRGARAPLRPPRLPMRMPEMNLPSCGIDCTERHALRARARM